MSGLAALLSPVMYTDFARELRRSDRVKINSHITYSGITGDTLVVGEGTAIDLSQEGVRIFGNQQVKPGMHLTLCLALPDYEGPLMIDEVRVIWANKYRFGVESVRIDKRSRLRLDHFLRFKKLMPPDDRQRVNIRMRL